MKKEGKQIIIYQAPSGAIELAADTEQETIWITQKQMAEIFSVDVRTINEHLKNIFKTKELDGGSSYPEIPDNCQRWQIIYYESLQS